MESKKLIRNNTSFPLQITAKLKQLYEEYNTSLTTELPWVKILKYYQYLIKELFSNSDFTEKEYARGLLIYHEMGMGKTRLAVAVAMSMWDTHNPVIILPQGLKKNFKKTIEEVLKLLYPDENQLSPNIIEEALAKFHFVSMDAYNSAKQLSKVKTTDSHFENSNKIVETESENSVESEKIHKTKKHHKKQHEIIDGGSLISSNGLDNKLLIVDESHNFFRSIINSSDENSNARKIYDAIMSAKNLKILFLTGTPCAKDPFELVPCFNMLTGTNLLPTSYEIFYSLYVDKATNSIINRNKLSNRIIGLVSAGFVNKSNVMVKNDQQAQSKRYNLAQSTNCHLAQSTNVKSNHQVQSAFPDKKELIISYVEMGPDQYKQYLLAREKEDAEKGSTFSSQSNTINIKPLSLPGSEKKSLGSYYVKSRILSIFAPPREYINTPIDKIPNKLFTEQNAPKLALIADRAVEAKGLVLVYSQFIDKGGIKPLTKYLENKGFTRYIV